MGGPNSKCRTVNEPAGGPAPGSQTGVRNARLGPHRALGGNQDGHGPDDNAHWPGGPTATCSRRRLPSPTRKGWRGGPDNDQLPPGRAGAVAPTTTRRGASLWLAPVVTLATSFVGLYVSLGLLNAFPSTNSATCSPGTPATLRLLGTEAAPALCTVAGVVCIVRASQAVSRARRGLQTENANKASMGSRSGPSA
jgi:hypothetical protein